MTWTEARLAYPDAWLVVEALQATTSPDHRRHLETLAVLETCPDGKSALDRYRELHRSFPQRELYFVHTSREELDIEERPWHGVRGGGPTRPTP